MSEGLLKVKDIAELTGMSEYTVRKKLREGEIEGERTSDREGYKVSRENLARYLQKAKKPFPAGLLSGIGLGFAAGGMGILGTLLLPLAPILAGGGAAIAGGIASLMDDGKGDSQEKSGNSKEILDLSVGSLEDQIEAIQYSIQAIELKGDELSVEDKQKILTGKAQIKLLERQIKELKLKYEMSQSI